MTAQTDRTALKTAAFQEIRQSSLAAESIERPADYQIPSAPLELLQAAQRNEPGARKALRQWHQRF